MADWRALTEGIAAGADFRQNFRANKQREKMRDYALEDIGREQFDKNASAKATADLIKDQYGVDTPLFEYEGLQDPFSYRLGEWFASKFGRGRRRAALDLGGAGTTGNATATTPAQTFAVPDPEQVEEGSYGYKDGGKVESPYDKKTREQYTEHAKGMEREKSPPGKAKVEGATQQTKGLDKTGAKEPMLDDKYRPVQKGQVGNKPVGLGRRVLNGALGRATVAGAGVVGALEGLNTPTEDYRKRFGLETDDPSFMGDLAVRGLGVAGDVGNALTLGLAGKLFRDKQGSPEPAPGAAADMPKSAPAAAPSQPTAPTSATSATRVSARGGRRAPAVPTAEPQMVDFSQIDIDAREVPDMKTEDWKQHRLQALQSAARKGIDPTSASEQVNDQITRMQQKGFLNYAKQGLVLQQAGNVRGAMAAYRAAYQYFPNGYDVEFGVHKGKIVGFGRDEATGKVVPGTEQVMDPERVAVFMANFQNPDVFRMWTKDWRDFQQGVRQYEETEKPYKESMASAALTNAQANANESAARADYYRMGGRQSGEGGYKQSDMRGDAGLFREAVQDITMEKPQDARFLLAVMGRIKAMRPDKTADEVVQGVRSAYEQGTLMEILKAEGIQ